jgi:phosphate transport system substrate-binding protein
LPLAQKEAEELMKTNSDVSVTVVGGGSGVGITAMIDGTTDRNGFKRLKTEEKMKFADEKWRLNKL